MTKIEYFEDTEDPRNTGWWICDYDKIGDEAPYDSVGPYLTKTEALRVWRDTTPDSKSKEPSDAGHKA